jgi:hypothetical protein
MIRAYAAAAAVVVVFGGFAVFTLLRLDGRVAYAGFTLVALVGVVLGIAIFFRTKAWERDWRPEIPTSTLSL